MELSTEPHIVRWKIRRNSLHYDDDPVEFCTNKVSRFRIFHRCKLQQLWGFHHEIFHVEMKYKEMCFKDKSFPLKAFENFLKQANSTIPKP
jgi:hypothetical protein